jgi:hypothetical protein
MFGELRGEPIRRIRENYPAAVRRSPLLQKASNKVQIATTLFDIARDVWDPVLPQSQRITEGR